ncbi:hypothetical protein CEXT_319481 [Caerostris extrusa]|uniref:Uncharacterized protein n=1 Tax=Caerostris extrusa TaxID=172846 RepID=A0AAV4X075_CAEEX|nr:hypothetical protein CEXT_319481 [Caerostris extrusa]
MCKQQKQQRQLSILADLCFRKGKGPCQGTGFPVREGPVKAVVLNCQLGEKEEIGDRIILGQLDVSLNLVNVFVLFPHHRMVMFKERVIYGLTLLPPHSHAVSQGEASTPHGHGHKFLSRHSTFAVLPTLSPLTTAHFRIRFQTTPLANSHLSGQWGKIFSCSECVIAVFNVDIQMPVP